ncbi:T9SS type A sorting domain-containing protein [bacterium]|nr:T9SS type A sorting domain-containing protein [bacterium]
MHSNAQYDYDLPIENGKWKEVEGYCQLATGVHPEWTYNYREYYSSGDTLINDTIYHKILNDNIYVGGLRQDTCKVFFRAAAGFNPSYGEIQRVDVDLMLYDFCVTDTYYSPFSGQERNVVAIDSVWVGDKKHKRIQFNDEFMPGNYWIEGIGSDGGLLKPTYQYGMLTSYDCGQELYLMCCKVGDELLYMREGLSDCGNIADGLNINKVSNIEITPNPANDVITIVSKQIINTIDITSLSGQLIKSSSSRNRSINIDISDLPNGIYLVKTNDSCTKFIKQ